GHPRQRHRRRLRPARGPGVRPGARPAVEPARGSDRPGSAAEEKAMKDLFPTVGWGSGYDRREVEEFFTRARSAYEGGTEEMDAEDVRTVAFELSRGGYDPPPSTPHWTAWKGHSCSAAAPTSS